MATVPGLFTDEAERVAAALSALEAHLPFLRAGWEGPAADIFFADMDTDIRPALRRLVHALRHGADVSAVMLRVLDDAEQAAARIDWSGGGVVGAATSGDGAVVAPVREDGRRGGGGVDVKRGGGANSRVNLQGSLYGQVQPPPSEDLPDTAAGRSARYREWAEALRQLPLPLNGIRFFDAAAHVTSIVGLLELRRYSLALSSLQSYFATRGIPVDFSAAASFLAVVGERLFELNLSIQNLLLSGVMAAVSDRFNDRVVSPLAGHPDFPPGYTVANALEFDIHMVFLEQGEVSAIIDSNPPTPAARAAINMLLNLKHHVLALGMGAGLSVRSVLPGPVTLSELSTLNSPLMQGVLAGATGAALVELLNGDTVFVDAAMAHLGEPIDFEREAHRVAMGIARVFQEHGRSHEEYMAYMETIEARGYTAPPSIGAPTGGAQEE